MTTYEIMVNGKSYDVSIQKKKTMATTSANETKTVAPIAAPVASVPKVAAPSPAAVVATGSAGKKVLAPMPGKIMSIKIGIGNQVKKGQELIIMEAMKMHNPILAANDGVITEIFVQVNDPVQSGQALLVIK